MLAMSANQPPDSAELQPAPALTRHFERKASRALLEQHIGLPTIIEALEFAIAVEPAEDEQGRPIAPSKFRLMYDHMLDPSTSSLPDKHTGRIRYPVDTVMAKFGVKLPELLALVGARNLGLAIAKSGTRLERVIDGLGEAAEPRIQDCTKCAGEGYLPGEDDEPAPECPRCGGSGEVRVFGDLKAAEMFIGLHGGSTSSRALGGHASGGVRDIIVSANAAASAKQENAGGGGEPINVRVQKLIDQ